LELLLLNDFLLAAHLGLEVLDGADVRIFEADHAFDVAVDQFEVFLDLVDVFLSLFNAQFQGLIVPAGLLELFELFIVLFAVLRDSLFLFC